MNLEGVMFVVTLLTRTCKNWPVRLEDLSSKPQQCPGFLLILKSPVRRQHESYAHSGLPRCMQVVSLADILANSSKPSESRKPGLITAVDQRKEESRRCSAAIPAALPVS